MAAIILFAAIFGGALLLLLARYEAPIGRERRSLGERSDRRPPMPAALLRSLTVQLLSALGFTVESESGERYLVATKPEPLGEIRYVVVLAPSPPRGVVDQAAVVALAEDVKGERAAVGLLITPGAIETAGLAGFEVHVELVDGARLRELIAQYLPHRLLEVDRHHGFGPAASSLQPLMST